MKFMFFMLCITLSSSLQAHNIFLKQGGISSLEIVGDTVYANGTPYCILTEKDNVHIIRTLDKQSIVYIQPVKRGSKYWYRIAIAPFNQVYYSPYANEFTTYFLHAFVKNKVIEDGYFSAYGANMLIKEYKDAGKYTEEWNLAAMPRTQPATADWNISWKATIDQDSIIILKDGVPFANYIHRTWRSYGVDRWEIVKATKAHYRYFVYKLDNTPMAEIRVADGWKTNVRILATDGNEYVIKEVPDNNDFMTIALKLLIAREELK